MILRICVVIRSFDHARTISEVVKGVLNSTPFPVLIIDDNSEALVSNVLYSWDVRGALETKRVRVERFNESRGKGRSIQFAVNKLAAEGFTHFVTMDASGVHVPSEINKLVALAIQHPWDLIIGDRNLQSPKPEKMSAWKAKLSNFWVSYQTGMHVKDTQSEFRLYPILAMQNLKFFGRSDNFDLSVLIRLLWSGIGVQETIVQVNEEPKKEPLSRAAKIWSDIRVSTLTGTLALISLFKTHRTPRELSFALGLGVFVGCTPFFGFHTLMIMALAVLLRLNLVVMWVGSHVSTPIIAPFVVMAEIWIGRHWLNVEGDFHQWLWGSVVLGVGLAVITTIFSYVIAWRMEKAKGLSSWGQSIGEGAISSALLRMTVRHLGQRKSYFLMNLNATWNYLFSLSARRGLGQYWKVSEPNLSFWKRQQKIYRQFFVYWQMRVDRMHHSEHPEIDFAAQGTGLEHAREILRKGKGALFLTAHIGIWDLAASFAGPNEFPGEIQIAKCRGDSLVFQPVNESLHADVVKVPQKGSTDLALKMYSFLDGGGKLALTMDRPSGDRFELYPLLGKILPLDVSIFRLLVARQIPAVFSFGFRGPTGVYEFFVSTPKLYKFEAKTSEEIQCYQWGQEFVVELERWLRKFPDQWFNFFTMWSSIPRTLGGPVAATNGNCIVEDLGNLTILKPDSSSELFK